MYRTLRIISVIIVTASAYLGIQYDFKSTGLLTDKGIIVICLGIFSGLAAIILEILEHKRQKKEDIERFIDKVSTGHPLQKERMRKIKKFFIYILS